MIQSDSLKAEQVNEGDWLMVSKHYAAAFRAGATPFQTGRACWGINHRKERTMHIEFIYVVENWEPELRIVELSCFEQISRITIGKK